MSCQGRPIDSHSASGCPPDSVLARSKADALSSQAYRSTLGHQNCLPGPGRGVLVPEYTHLTSESTFLSIFVHSARIGQWFNHARCKPIHVFRLVRGFVRVVCL